MGLDEGEVGSMRKAPSIAEIAAKRKTAASQTEKATDLQPHEAIALKAHDVEIPHAAPGKGESSAPIKRTSTSLYLTPAAHRAIRLHAAERGVRPHRVYDDALRAYFKANGLDDFDKLNSTE